MENIKRGSPKTLLLFCSLVFKRSPKTSFPPSLVSHSSHSFSGGFNSASLRRSLSVGKQRSSRTERSSMTRLASGPRCSSLKDLSTALTTALAAVSPAAADLERRRQAWLGAIEQEKHNDQMKQWQPVKLCRASSCTEIQVSHKKGIVASNSEKVLYKAIYRNT